MESTVASCGAGSQRFRLARAQQPVHSLAMTTATLKVAASAVRVVLEAAAGRKSCLTSGAR